MESSKHHTERVEMSNSNVASFSLSVRAKDEHDVFETQKSAKRILDSIKVESAMSPERKAELDRMTDRFNSYQILDWPMPDDEHTYYTELAEEAKRCSELAQQSKERLEKGVAVYRKVQEYVRNIRAATIAREVLGNDDIDYNDIIDGNAHALRELFEKFNAAFGNDME